MLATGNFGGTGVSLIGGVSSCTGVFVLVGVKILVTVGVGISTGRAVAVPWGVAVRFSGKLATWVFVGTIKLDCFVLFVVGVEIVSQLTILSTDGQLDCANKSSPIMATANKNAIVNCHKGKPVLATRCFKKLIIQLPHFATKSSKFQLFLLLPSSTLFQKSQGSRQ